MLKIEQVLMLKTTSYWQEDLVGSALAEQYMYGNTYNVPVHVHVPVCSFTVLATEIRPPERWVHILCDASAAQLRGSDFSCQYCTMYYVEQYQSV